MSRTKKAPARNKRTPPLTLGKTQLTVAVISDVHAYQGIEPDKAPSHCDIADGDPSRNPLAGVKQLIQDKKLRADVLLCPGDLGDKGVPVATQYVWRELHDVKKLLGAGVLAATTGNHDIDSRHVHNAFDAKGMLQSLNPKYPFDDDSLNDRYWSRHFVIIRKDVYRILVLNSSAFHGEGRFDEKKRHEYEHGRISDHTITGIRKALDSSTAAKVNILLCHHHPHPHSELRLGTDDLMQGGQQLLELLGSGKYGSWIVIHGHKHHAKIEHAAGGNSSPIVFAAGSLAYVLYRELQTEFRNQFYLIEFPFADFEKLGFVGRFRAWDFLSHQGWREAGRESKLPGIGGFGWRGDVQRLASTIAAKVKAKKSMRWADIVSKVPEISFLMPQDLANLVAALRGIDGILVDPDNVVPPTLIGRKP